MTRLLFCSVGQEAGGSPSKLLLHMPPSSTSASFSTCTNQNLLQHENPSSTLTQDWVIENVETVPRIKEEPCSPNSKAMHSLVSSHEISISTVVTTRTLNSSRMSSVVAQCNPKPEDGKSSNANHDQATWDMSTAPQEPQNQFVDDDNIDAAERHSFNQLNSLTCEANNHSITAMSSPYFSVSHSLFDSTGDDDLDDEYKSEARGLETGEIEVGDAAAAASAPVPVPSGILEAGAIPPHYYSKSAYICQECGKCFSSSFTLSVHSRCHVEDRPHQCPHCDYRAKLKHHIKCHVKRRHPQDTSS